MRPFKLIILIVFVTLVWLLYPLVFLTTALALDVIFNWPSLWREFFYLKTACGILIIAAYFSALWAIAALTKYGHGFGFWLPPQQLVSSGPYRLLRHPMSLAALVILGSIAIIGNSPAALLILLPLHIIALWLYIRLVEEPKLNNRFSAYPDYRATHCGLLPSLSAMLIFSKSLLTRHKECP